MLDKNQGNLNILREGGARLEDGHFRTKAGMCTNVYYLKPSEFPKETLERVVSLFINKLRLDDVQIIAGVPSGGTYLAEEIIRQYRNMTGREIPLLKLEKCGKSFCFKKGENIAALKGKDILVVEDNTSTSGSLNDVIALLRNKGANVFLAAVLVDRRSPGQPRVATELVRFVWEEVPVFDPPCEKCLQGIPWDNEHGHGKYHQVSQFELALPP